MKYVLEDFEACGIHFTAVRSRLAWTLLTWHAHAAPFLLGLKEFGRERPPVPANQPGPALSRYTLKLRQGPGTSCRIAGFFQRSRPRYDGFRPSHNPTMPMTAPVNCSPPAPSLPTGA